MPVVWPVVQESLDFGKMNLNLNNLVNMGKNMTSITIALPEDVLEKLQELAKRRRVAPEDLIRASVEELVSPREESFPEALNYVLQKNKELYERLAG